MARALAAVLDVDVKLITYENPGDVADAAMTGAWDIGNIGAEPARAEFINFTDAYAEIESTYLVPADSPINTIADVDQPGMRISVKERAAYALWLESNLEHAELIQTESLDSAFDTFVDRRLDALAGLRPRLEADVKHVPGGRVLDGKFSSVMQAIGHASEPRSGRYRLAPDVRHRRQTAWSCGLADHENTLRMACR